MITFYDRLFVESLCQVRELALAAYFLKNMVASVIRSIIVLSFIQSSSSFSFLPIPMLQSSPAARKRNSKFSLAVISSNVFLQSLVAGVATFTPIAALAVAPTCSGSTATIYVESGFIVGGPDNGLAYAGTLNGTAGNDVMVGTSGDDVINSLGGTNKICALEGSNTVNGGSGNDTITAGSGDDEINTAGGTNVVTDDGGANEITGGSGNDTVTTGTGDDTIDLAGGTNSVTDAGGNNEITGGSGNDTIVAGLGDDIIDVAGGTNDVTDAGGDNVVTGGSGNDSVVTGGGNDIITLAGGTNGSVGTRIQSGAGNDSIVGGSGNDHFDGGNGTDYCDPIGTGGSNTTINCEASGLEGVITIMKDAQPDDDQDFGFTGSVGAFLLDDDADGTLSNSYTVVLSGALLGTTYTVTEDSYVDWNLYD